jgi:hypothetical protein
MLFSSRSGRLDKPRVLVSPLRLKSLTIGAAAALAGIAVFHPALGYFFSQDDFLGLARAAGLLPRLTQPWRYIANQAVWDVMRPIAGLNPWPYHLLSLIAHVSCVLLLYRQIASRLSTRAALLGATFFAVHPSLFAALHWISTIGDLLALAFGLLALEAADRADRRRWLAPPLFAMSLLSKESLVLLPLVVLAWRAFGPEPAAASGGKTSRATSGARARRFDGILVALTALAAIYVVYFVALAYGTYFGLPHEAISDPGESGRPYALGLGANLWRNLLTLLGWTVAFALPLMQRFSNAVEPGVFPWAVAAIAVWGAGLLSPRLRRLGWLFGGVTWLLFALPVLPLANHIYHYYLYAPLAGAAWCLAAGAEWLLAPRAAPAGRRVAPRPAAPPAWGIAALGALLLTVNGALVHHKTEHSTFVLPELRSSSIIDRSLIAQRVYRSLADADLPAGTTLLFWSPIASTLGPHGETLTAPAPVETYWEANVRTALVDGLAVRVLLPRVAGVEFVREFHPAASNCRYAVYRPEGKTGVVTPEVLNSIIQGAGGTH